MKPTWIALASTLLLARAVCAQDTGASISGTVAAMNLASRTNVSISGSFGFKFNRVVGLELETTWLPDMRTDFGNLPTILIYPAPTYANEKGRAVFFTNDVRVDIPTTVDRVVPYFVAGAGVAHVRQTAELRYPIYRIATTNVPTPVAGVALPVLPVEPLIPTSQPISTSAVNLALTLGGGVSINLASHLALDVDLRLFRLLGENDRNAGRFGVGARYRFGR